MNGFIAIRLPEPGNWDIIVDSVLSFRIRRAPDGGSRVEDRRRVTSQAITGWTGHMREVDAMTQCVRLMMEGA